MENNKYYAPEIEEFCVGFECEMRNSSDPKYFDWEKCIFKNDFSCELNEDYCFEYLFNDLKEGNIRVKYLNEQDILDCEFQYHNSMLDFIKVYSKYIIRVRLRKELNQISIFQKYKYSENELRLFCGKIKNKNEFKKILKQIEVDD